MKTLLAFILLLFTFQQQRDYDTIDISKVSVKNKLNQVYKLGSAGELQKAFGKAVIKKEPDEVLGGNAYTYTYKGFETYFNERNWESTDIKSADYEVVLNSTSYKVGDNISKLKKQFPISYKNSNYSVIGIFLTHKKQVLDAAVNFSYNNKGVITMILISNDNS